MASVRTQHAGVVAIVEDDAGMRSAVNRVLEAEGYLTEQFGSAEEFLAGGGQARARCLVLDLCLPGMSGVELMRCLRSEAAALPTVLVTGYDVPVQWAEMTGAECCLIKPFSPELLLQMVQRCVAQGETRDPRAV